MKRTRSKESSSIINQRPKPKGKSRKDIFNSLLIPISKRWPPNDNTPVLLKLEGGLFSVSTGEGVNCQLEQLQSGHMTKQQLLSEGEYIKRTGYFTVAWMKLYNE